MSRMTDDGAHEGYIAHVFADGMSGSGSSNGGPTVTHRADGTRIPYEDRQSRSWDEVIGFQAVCDGHRGRPCWRGPVWARVATPMEGLDDTAYLDPFGDRRVHAPNRFGLSESAEDLLMQAWDEHIAPFRGCYAVEVAAEAVAEAQQELTAAVRAAREQGASWEAIGQAAGMTRQSAHERWAKVINRG